jgi:hypothetical protein
MFDHTLHDAYLDDRKQQYMAQANSLWCQRSVILSTKFDAELKEQKKIPD